MKDNKLIAEFMDYTHVLLPVSVGLEYYDGDEMEYYTSWEWLMPVVDKIDLILPDDSFVIISFNRCLIEWVNVEGLGNTRREATYKAVVEFINQYNKNK